MWIFVKLGGVLAKWREIYFYLAKNNLKSNTQLKYKFWDSNPNIYAMSIIAYQIENSIHVSEAIKLNQKTNLQPNKYAVIALSCCNSFLPLRLARSTNLLHFSSTYIFSQILFMFDFLLVNFFDKSCNSLICILMFGISRIIVKLY